MLLNLFSPMDPSSSFMNFNWLSMLIPFFFIKINILFPLFPRNKILLYSIINFMKKEIMPLLKSMYSSGLLLIIFSLFMIIMYSNLMGLTPYTFTHTSHMSFNFPLSLTLWISIIMYSWKNSTSFMLAHLIPQSTPSPLIPFMVLIETTSQLIRPLTLAVRLSTNMIAGHLLIILLSSIGPSISLSFYPFILIPQMILILLESAVALIQAYVLTILLTLYLSEIN